MRAAVYAQVSTLGKGQDPGLQLREFSDCAERRGWTAAGEYVDVGISGAKDRRPELDRLMADAHRRKFDDVVVWKFDRFARSVSHLLRALENFQALGIEFVSLTEGVDTSTPAGKMVFTILGAVAELERSLICERVKAGLRNVRAKGKRLGRPLRYLIAFIPVATDIRAFLTAAISDAMELVAIESARAEALHLHIAPWPRPYAKEALW